ncbi:MAG: PAS domain S-box protein [Sphingobacteriales bacterium]|jgi:PAS domain S-box-containing protein|nr:PAS domain S-box protein [Sphingobacteriales bacterium]NCT76895.1 PAS domain S-box protein [Chitinophagaceae bacterium]OJW33249.1 MAG: hypothetical protein BGO54_08190 [Sphingobacteriales bacterium 46-32]
MTIDQNRITSLHLLDFFNLTPDLVCIAGTDGYWKAVNQSVIDKLGYSEKELLAHPIDFFVHPDDLERTRARRDSLFKGNRLTDFQNRYITFTGEELWLEWSSIFFPDQQLVFAIAKDITARKQIELQVKEEYLKYKSLATHFKSTLEEGRKFLATELHEELAQLAIAAKINVDWINRYTPDLPAQSRERLGQTTVITDLMIQAIRRISFAISPHMIDDLGLRATLEWHCREFSLLNNIACFFEAEYDETKLSKEVQIDFFRICQEAMDNVIVHAKASAVRIIIESTDEQIILSICDNGIGFDPDTISAGPGLIIMRERAVSINARLSIRSKPNRGTRVSIALPVSVKIEQLAGAY